MKEKQKEKLSTSPPKLKHTDQSTEQDWKVKEQITFFRSQTKRLKEKKIGFNLDSKGMFEDEEGDEEMKRELKNDRSFKKEVARKS